MMNGECGHKAGAPAGVQLVEGDESLVFFVHVDHVNLFVDGGLGGEFGGDFSHGFAVPDAAVDAHELFAVLSTATWRGSCGSVGGRRRF